jgi:hypothetical protein
VLLKLLMAEPGETPVIRTSADSQVGTMPLAVRKTKEPLALVVPRGALA